MFIYQLFTFYYEENSRFDDFHWNNLVGYKELVNFLLYQIHVEKSLKSMENKNLLKAVGKLTDNSFYVNIVYPLLITKIDLEDTSEVDTFFEMLA